MSNRRSFKSSLSIAEKANWVLNLILVAFILIILRIWYLTIIQHEVYEERARRPQKRTLTEPAKRGTIRDRFNLPLAINRIQYNAAIVYAPLRQIPAVQWETLGSQKTKIFKRKIYIENLSQLLASKLGLDKKRIEDLIYSKGALYNKTPFVIKEDITEKEYYALKSLERQWPGLEMQIIPRRFYPYGKVAGDIVGYLGAINRAEYEKIMQEMAFLEEQIKIYKADLPLLPESFANIQELQQRLKELQDKAYTLNDAVGKAGVEARYERHLRGIKGKRSFYTNARGNFLKELPGSRAPLSGRRILLSLSVELQEYAEQLLIQNEKIRQTRATVIQDTRQKFTQLQAPWIKGGAIIALDPNSGEIVALASLPRIDPNDFVASGDLESQRQKRSNIAKWFETDSYIGELWDQKRALERECWNTTTRQVEIEEKLLTWPVYIESVLPKNHALCALLQKDLTIKDAATIENSIERLLQIQEGADGFSLINAVFPNDLPYGTAKISLKANMAACLTSEKKILNTYLSNISQNYEKLLLIDLLRLAVDSQRFTPSLLDEVGNLPLSLYRELNISFGQLAAKLCEMSKELYHDTHFLAWRQENEKAFLAQKRAEEKAQKKYAKPYLDLLDQKEAELFTSFWCQYRWQLLQMFISGNFHLYQLSELEAHSSYFKNWQQEIQRGAHQELPWVMAYLKLQQAFKKISPTQQIPFLQTMRSYRELTRPLLGKYPGLRTKNQRQYEKDLAAAFYPRHGYGYGRSHAYRQATTQGSLFKLVTAYAAMLQHPDKEPANYENLLQITDKVFKIGQEVFVGYDADNKPIPRFYHGGRLPRSSGSNFGKMDVVRAIETSSNPYFSLLAGDILKSPDDLAAAAKAFSYGSRTGLDLPAEIAGNMPNDLCTNRTGLYAMAIGQHTLVATPLQTSVMLAAIANAGKVLMPKVGLISAGCLPTHENQAITCWPSFKYQDSLSLVGIDFPLFLAIDSSLNHVEARKFSTTIKDVIAMPSAVRKVLLDGMLKVVQRSQKEGLTQLSRLYSEFPEAISDYIDLKKQLLGKTSTAESIERLNLSLQDGVHIYNHIWFGGISFLPDSTHKYTTIAKDPYGAPELVVVVYLRFGGFGKESAPLAAQIVAKWREIKARNSQVP